MSKRFMLMLVNLTLILSILLTACGSKDNNPVLESTRPTTTSVQATATSPPTTLDETALDRLPLRFEVNEGQADAAARFLAHGHGYNVLLTPHKVMLGLLPTAARSLPTVVGLEFVAAAPETELMGQDKLSGVVNYYLSLDPAQWHTDIPTYASVKYKGVYPGIDAVFYGSQQQLEHDFVVAPGHDPGAITLRTQGVDSLALSDTGDLVLAASGSELRLRKPFIYQEVNGARREVDGGYTLRGDQQFSFEVAAYDASRPLIIDPVVVYSSYLGGSSTDFSHAVTTDTDGNIYITGATNSTNFPVLNPLQGYSDGGINCPTDVTPYRLCYDAFVTKLSPSGTDILYSTYFGLYGDDEGHAIAVDDAGNAYMAGYLNLNGPPPLEDSYTYDQAVVFKLTPTGGWGFAAWWGIDASEAHGIALDAAGQIYVTGQTSNDSFPTSPNALQPERLELIDGFVSVLDPTGQNLVYSTFLGGSGEYCGVCYSKGNAIAVDSTGTIYVTGQAAPSFPTTANAYQRDFDGFWMAFVAKIDPTAMGAAGLVYSTYLGGELNEFGNGIALDASGNVYVTGSTNSDNFPTTPGAYDRTCGTDGICNTLNNVVCDYTPPGMPPICHLDSKADVFVAKLDPTQSGASSLIYSTYVGGAGRDEGFHLALDATDNVFVTGITVSPDFPVVNPYQAAIGGAIDAFVFELRNTGSALNYSTFLGGSEDDGGTGITVDMGGNAVVTGYTSSVDFTVLNPLQPRADGTEAFVAKIGPSLGAPTSLTATAVSQAQINLSWIDNSSDESDFHIERSADGGTGWTEIGTAGANVISHSSTGLTCGTTYYYRVRAHRHSDSQFSNYSNTASATTQECSFSKSSPTNGASGVSASPTLSWSSDTNATSYEYCIDTINNNTCDAVWISTSSATNKALSGLTYGTTYYWQVRALNSVAPAAYADNGTWWSFSTQTSIFLPIVIR